MAVPSQLPVGSSLFIAAPSAIQACSQSSTRTLFECATDGIVNAKAAKDNSGLLAVADSHLVVLHDVARGDDKKYRLKSAEVRSRGMTRSRT